MKPCIPAQLPIRGIDWKGLVSLIGEANRAVASYDGVLFSLRNSHILTSPMMTQEAVLSSRIEGTQATLGEVLKFGAGDEPEEESKRNDIVEILDYREARPGRH